MKVIVTTVLTIAFFGISALAFHHGGCRRGNTAVAFQEPGGPQIIACCVPVGGGYLSCVAGGCWFNYPEVVANPEDASVPNCAF